MSSFKALNTRGQELSTDIVLHWLSVQVYYDLFIERKKEGEAA